MQLDKDHIKIGLRNSWGWITALGMLMMLFGAFIVISPLNLFTASLTIEVLVALGLCVTGILQFMHAWHEKNLQGRMWYALGGLVYALGGLFLIFHPTAGLVSMVLLLAIIMVADGIFMTILGLQSRGRKGWLWLLASGAVSVLVGAILFTDIKSSSSWALGFFVGVAFLVEGVSFTSLGIEARKLNPDEQKFSIGSE